MSLRIGPHARTYADLKNSMACSQGIYTSAQYSVGSGRARSVSQHLPYCFWRGGGSIFRGSRPGRPPQEKRTQEPQTSQRPEFWVLQEGLNAVSQMLGGLEVSLHARGHMEAHFEGSEAGPPITGEVHPGAAGVTAHPVVRLLVALLAQPAFVTRHILWVRLQMSTALHLGAQGACRHQRSSTHQGSTSLCGHCKCLSQCWKTCALALKHYEAHVRLGFILEQSRGSTV